MFDSIKNIEVVKDLGNSIFKKMVKDLWELSEVEIHPFQKGDTQQASEHCANVIKNISRIIEKIKLNKLEKYLLCCSAIVHDIDKAVIDYKKKIAVNKKHGEVSANFITEQPELLKFTVPVAEAVSVIVRHHGHIPLTKIHGKYKSKKIPSPKACRKYKAVDLEKLAAIFRIADMADVTYKRVSDIILKLNFPNGITEPKIIARQRFSDVIFLDDRITIVTRRISLFEEYQAIVIAVSMMNEELDESGTKKILKNLGLPSFFQLDDLDISDEIKFICYDRNKLSYFDKEFQLKISEIDNSKMKDVYEKNEHIYRFSPNELIQLRSKCEYIYKKATMISISDVSERLKILFGWSIEKMIVIRKYSQQGRIIETLVEYQNIEKPREYSQGIKFEVSEDAANACVIGKNCAISNIPAALDSVLKFPTKKKCYAAWPDISGFEKIKKLHSTLVFKNAWAIKRSDIAKIYPDHKGNWEEFILEIKYPVCEVQIILIFPANYKIDPRCKFKSKGKWRNLKLLPSDDYKFTIKNLHQEDIDRNNYPTYQIRWDIPEK